MKTGTPLNTLAERIITEARSKRDYIADTRKLNYSQHGEMIVDVNGENRIFKPTPLCIQQVASRVGIPAKYVERMQAGHGDLLSQNINHWFVSQPERRMVRTFDNGAKTARAFLSDRYRPLDNYDLSNVILPKLAAAGCEVKSCELTERRLYIQAVTSRIEGEIKKGDVVQAGIVISNSEVGCGAVKVEPMLYRLVCLNGMISGDSIRRYHVGRAGNGDDNQEDGNPLFSDRTMKLTDKAFWAQVCDVVDGSLNQIKFNSKIQEIREKADGKSVGNPVDVVEVLANRLELSETEQKNVLQHLTTGGSLDLWGVTNAVTRAAEDCESYDRAIELERAGAIVLAMKPSDFAAN